MKGLVSRGLRNKTISPEHGLPESGQNGVTVTTTDSGLAGLWVGQFNILFYCSVK